MILCKKEESLDQSLLAGSPLFTLKFHKLCITLLMVQRYYNISAYTNRFKFFYCMNIAPRKRLAITASRILNTK
jgi:hypothetical protein|nr:MAG TPA: hypothetical protein [Caudoviricetes sp.]